MRSSSEPPPGGIPKNSCSPQEGRDLAGKAREGTAKPEDVTGGTFTITNLDALDIDAFTPIINPPQLGIIGVGRVVEKPEIKDEQVSIGTTMYLSLTFDHRIVDGAPATEFLQSVKGYLEDPWWMVHSWRSGRRARSPFTNFRGQLHEKPSVRGGVLVGRSYIKKQIIPI